ncbi:hypothetical protein AOQ84DRAFT_441594 [Glonium stellatum]|uniref:BTB domain-containing protein n=1 Tax=Glonium stellatum TaxID=574774 RepID=A0A8E2JQ30_9PEZI|nr:hypothetical protein AOQ84DRAFT_441594 [Glonium stellatum]
MSNTTGARRHRRSLVDISKPPGIPIRRANVQEAEREPRSSVRISVNDGPKRTFTRLLLRIKSCIQKFLRIVKAGVFLPSIPFSFVKEASYSISLPLSLRLTPHHLLWRPRLGYQSIIVRVGDETDRTDFSVHEDLICGRSRFFANAMRHDWKEAEDRVVPLPDDLPSTFAVYRTWLYSGLLASRGFSTAEEWGVLCSAYILGEKLQDSEFKDTVVDAMIEKINEEPAFEFNPEMVVEIYENTPPQSHARRLLVDLYTFAGKPSWLSKEKREFLHEDFLYALSVQFMKYKDRSMGILAPYHHQSTCAYHEHGGKLQGPCYKTKKFPWKSAGDESPRWTAVDGVHSDVESEIL